MATSAIASGPELLGETGFAALVGASPECLAPACREVLAAADFSYTVLRGRERENCLLQALRAASDRALPASGPQRAGDWQRGWHENLRALEASGNEPVTLIPRYNKYDVLRLAGDYVRVADRGFEYGFYTALRAHLFAHWFRSLGRIVEFGCGTGTSLLQLAAAFPDAELVGCDWAPASQEILARLSTRLGRTIRGHRFDMFAPDAGLALGPGTAVLTSAALEQLGPRHDAFVDYLLAGRPSLCLHIEPICELYDSNDLFDEVALRYHRHRNYLVGFLPRLRELEREGRAEILEVRRTGFGSFFHEGYSVVAWRPAGARA